MSYSPKDGEIPIDASQLRPGVHVRLPVSWVQNPFMRSSFVIADEEQVRTIVGMKLPQLFCDPTRCEVSPLPLRPLVTPPSEVATIEDGAEVAPAAPGCVEFAEPQEHAASAITFRENLDVAQSHYLRAAQTVGKAIKDFPVNPTEATRQAALVSENSVMQMLADPDSAIILITEKAQSEGHAAHSLSVMTLTLLLGRQANLPEQALRILGTAALLHDIGKEGVSPSILRSSERNRHEEAIYQAHCRNGFNAAARVDGVSPAMLDAILYHHERFDGGGFPTGLSGNNIPLAARIVAIANLFDNLVNPVDYRHALPPSNTLSTMWTREQKSFDRVLLQLFVRAMGVYPPGSLVQLTDHRIGVVVSSAGAAKPLSPQVMIYSREVPRRQALIIDLAQVEGISIASPVSAGDLAVEELDYLLPRRKLKWSHMARTP
ncbi:MAG TPA: DUF3391 domain-containing protein [Accumulibacter sp.]|uniref:HD-GYP domain-containing protein n=1 Tax=Accumulibacter sp. TaxID=2053492 RepID=UPI0025F0B45F|nr:HD domain-containing phosphohydrolase [Accumulibacter sp.]MCM8599510.1 DUF3391 domain-containing protein [Accumulibacter sp.]MCM8662418.1 DUF3391 domain-containing protein [Accumulibacter sp.]HNC52137.1 DUF3391 domain-containing protein [Accumulibacter sp.]